MFWGGHLDPTLLRSIEEDLRRMVTESIRLDIDHWSVFKFVDPISSEMRTVADNIFHERLPSNTTLRWAGSCTLVQVFEHVEIRETRGPMVAFGDPTAEIVQPVSHCDGSKRYAYDAAKENGRGAPLDVPCVGCRACR